MIYDCVIRRNYGTKNLSTGRGAGFDGCAANDTVGIGVIGLGGRGRDRLKYYSKLPDALVMAICDLNQAQTERAVFRAG
jgi:hypothetical protein